MAGATLQPILNRLNGVPQYHPGSAETFADWTLEAGDIVRLKRMGQNYDTPVMVNTMRWNGQAKSTMEFDGQKERKAISKVSKQKFSGGGGGIQNSKDLYALTQNFDELNGDFTQYVVGPDGLIHTGLWQGRENIAAVAGEFDLVEDPTTHEKTMVVKSGGGMKILRDDVEYGLYDDGNLTGGLMVQMINEQTTAKLLGDHIVIGDSDDTVDDMYTDFSGSITEINGDLVTIQSDITSIESEQVDINADIVDLLTRVLSLESDELEYHVRTQNLEDANVNIHADINGLESTIDTVQSSVDTIEGTALWQYHDEIGAFAGIMYKGTDQKLHIRSGSGLMIDEGQSSLGVYTEGNLTAAVIVNKINGGTVKISAANIVLDGDAVAQSLEGKTIGAGTIQVYDLEVDRSFYCEASGNFEGNLDVGGNLTKGTRTYNLIDASVSGNTLTITKADGTTINFNKVTTPTLHGSWSGGILSITSTPEAESNLYFYLGRGTVTWSGVTGTVPITAAPSSSSPGSTVYTTTVTAPFHKVNDSSGRQTFTAYYYNSSGSLESMGSHSWYYHT